MTATTGRLSLPRISDGPLALAQQPGDDRHEDWSEIEAILASSAPVDGSARVQPGRGSARLVRSSIVASVVLAGLLGIAFWTTRGDCGFQAGCSAPMATADVDGSPSVLQGRSVSTFKRDRH